jgi:hypothetical protein
MHRKLPLTVCTLILGLMLAGNVFAATTGTTYYIAANGSDSNSGTSKTSPWVHAPGMKNCANTCAATTPKAGDQFIFRGGDTWHFGNSSATPYVGAYQSFGYWQWSWAGTSGSPIYIGVDQTWYSGSSWVRPVFTGDNPLSTSFPSSCPYSADNKNYLFLGYGTVTGYVSYVTLDSFDWQGKCWTSANSSDHGTIFSYQTDHIIIENSYFHGWTVVQSQGSNSNHEIVLGNTTGPLGGANYNQFISDVFDGSDSSQGAGGSSACSIVVNPNSPCVSGFGLNIDGYDIHNSVFRYLTNAAIVGNLYTVHDNLFEYMEPSYDDITHPNIIYADGGIAGSNQYFYNNIVRHTYQNIGFNFYVNTNLYFFNNVLFDNSNVYGGGVANQNCILLNNSQSSGSVAAYFYNNTIDGYLAAQNTNSCILNLASSGGGPGSNFKGTVTFENNHLISYSSAGLSSFYNCTTPSTCTITDNGNEVFQTEAAANGQGYTTSNSYAPTSTGGATYQAGANTSSSCSTFSVDSGLCNGTSGGSSEQSGSGGFIANDPAIPIVSRGSTWDAGAYEYSSSNLNPPTGLTAVVQ